MKNPIKARRKGNADMTINPDTRPLSDFGVLHEGAFNGQGCPCGWIVDAEQHAADLPLSLKDQPVLTWTHKDAAVYVRGLYSARLSNMRHEAVGRGH